jgi:anti-anti-sigma factor
MEEWMCGQPVIHSEQLGERAWLISLGGEHDLATSGELRAVISDAFCSRSEVLLDLCDASFVDSAVIGAILDAYDESSRQADEEAFLVIAQPGTPPRRVLDLLGADSIALFDDRASALETLNRSRVA